MHQRIISLLKFGGTDSGVSEFDIFGLAPSFKVAGSNHFKTRFGFFISFIWFALIVGAIVYFVERYYDKTKPEIIYDRFRSDKYMDADLIKNEFYYWFKVRNEISSNILSPNEFFKNFALHGVLSTYVYDVDPYDPTSKTRSDYVDAKSIKFVPCKDAKWVQKTAKSLELTDSSNVIDQNIKDGVHSDTFKFDFYAIQTHGICMDEDSMRFFSNYGAQRKMHIELRRCGEL